MSNEGKLLADVVEALEAAGFAPSGTGDEWSTSRGQGRTRAHASLADALTYARRFGVNPGLTSFLSAQVKRLERDADRNRFRERKVGRAIAEELEERAAKRGGFTPFIQLEDREVTVHLDGGPGERGLTPDDLTPGDRAEVERFAEVLKDKTAEIEDAVGNPHPLRPPDPRPGAEVEEVETDEVFLARGKRQGSPSDPSALNFEERPDFPRRSVACEEERLKIGTRVNHRTLDCSEGTVVESARNHALDRQVYRVVWKEVPGDWSGNPWSWEELKELEVPEEPQPVRTNRCVHGYKAAVGCRDCSLVVKAELLRNLDPLNPLNRQQEVVDRYDLLTALAELARVTYESTPEGQPLSPGQRRRYEEVGRLRPPLDRFGEGRPLPESDELPVKGEPEPFDPGGSPDRTTLPDGKAFNRRTGGPRPFASTSEEGDVDVDGFEEGLRNWYGDVVRQEGGTGIPVVNEETGQVVGHLKASRNRLEESFDPDDLSKDWGRRALETLVRDVQVEPDPKDLKLHGKMLLGTLLKLRGERIQGKEPGPGEIRVEDPLKSGTREEAETEGKRGGKDPQDPPEE